VIQDLQQVKQDELRNEDPSGDVADTVTAYCQVLRDLQPFLDQVNALGGTALAFDESICP
jgi:hypothetical protein